MFHSDMEPFSMWTVGEKIVIALCLVGIAPCALVLIGAFFHFIGVF